MSDAIKPADEKAAQVSQWLQKCLEIIRSKMEASGYPVDGYDIGIIFKDGEIHVKVTR